MNPQRSSSLDVPAREGAGDVRLGVMEDADLGRVRELRASVGWPADPLAFDLLRGVRDARWAVAEVAGNGRQLAGMVGVVPLGRRGIVFHLAVRGSWRGAGLGRALSLWAVAYLRSRGASTVRLYATTAAEGLYASLGFAPVGRRTVYRWESEGVRGEPGEGGCRVTPLAFGELPELCGTDYWTYGGDRSALILAILRLHDGSGWLARDRTGRIQGYLVGSSSDATVRLGPLAAADAGVARALLLRALDGSQRATITVPAPAAGDPAAGAVLDELGFVGLPDRTCMELRSAAATSGTHPSGAGLALYGTTPYLAT